MYMQSTSSFEPAETHHKAGQGINPKAREE
jgi:hypothetical protein